MIGWIVALVLTAVFAVVYSRQRKRSAQRLDRVRRWLDELIAERAPETRVVDPALHGIGERIDRAAKAVEKIHREHTDEATNLQTILSSMADGVMVIDSHHVIRRVNPSILRILDLRVEPVGQTVLRALRDVSFEELVVNTLRETATQSIEITVGPSKNQTHLALTATPMRDTSGETHILLICRDITRLKQLEDVRREFVANVSHELRTPLAIFQGYLENLLDYPDQPREDLIEVFEVLRKHSNRLNALVEDLLIIARLESRTEKLNLEMIDPVGLIRDTVADWKGLAAKKDITISTGEIDGAPEFEADALRIEQVLNNLVENAIKYTEAGGAIVVGASRCSTGVEIRVDDTGVGITPQDLPHVFERFYRVDKARSREQGGTGLGLSIVKHIAHLHGGTVHAESTYGRGTSIFLRLPLLQPPPSSNGEAVHPAANESALPEDGDVRGRDCIA